MREATKEPKVSTRAVRTSQVSRPAIRRASLRCGFLEPGDLFETQPDAPLGAKDGHVVRIISKMTAYDESNTNRKFPEARVRKSLNLLSDADLQQVEDEMDLFAFTGIRGKRMGQLFPFIKFGRRK